MPMPVDAESCTATVAVPVPIRRRHAGTVAIRAAASMASGRGDRDRVRLRCRPAPPAGTLAAIQRAVFAPSCASFSCHGTAAAGGLDLTPDRAAASLVGVAPSNGPARAAGLLRVAPGDPDRSFLLRKLLADLGPGEGEPMPRVGQRLPAARIALVRSWILAGAPVP
jgi:hypothetical protein